MKYTFRYYFSLGFSWAGGGVYSKDTFNVKLNKKQDAKIKALLNDEADKAPAFEQIRKHLPEIDSVIMDELRGLAYDYVIMDGYYNGYYDVSDEDVMKEDIKRGDFDPTKCEGYKFYGDLDDEEYDEDDEIDNRLDLWQEWERKKIEAMNLRDQAA